jgi:hypothetical protein
VEDTKLITERRMARTDTELGISSDDKEIPTPSDGSKPVGWWLSEQSCLQASADGAQGVFTCEGTTALAVTGERVLGIVSPNDETTPAVWFSWSLPALKVQTAGEKGFLKKRPTSITLTFDGAIIELSALSRLWRNSGRYQTGQEGSLLKALKA